MNKKPLGRLTAGWIAAILLATPMLQAGTGDFAVPLGATPPPVEDEWRFAVALHGWLPAIQGTTITGAKFKIDLDDILESLNMTAMLSVGAAKGKWFFGSDLIYLDLSTNIYEKKGSAKIMSDVGLTAWIVNPTVGYNVLEGDWGRLNVLGGARYLYIKGTLGLWTRLPRNSSYIHGSGKGHSWAGIIGVVGQINLSDRWYIPYYADVGTGDPDVTWQVYAAIAYRFNNFDLVLGYRYLDWEMDSSGALSELYINGPMLGVKFDF